MTLLLFWTKKIVARSLFPVPFVLELVVIGALLCVWKRTQRAGRIMIFSGLVLLFVLSLPIVGRQFLIPLETQYPRLDTSTFESSAPCVICVAGSAWVAHAGFNDSFLVRLQEAGRIATDLERREVDYSLVVSVRNTDTSHEQKVTAVLEFFDSFRIAHEKIEVIDDAKNSAEEIASFAKHAGQLVLVSSASHMPRLMLLAAVAHVEALAAPAGWKANEEKITPLDFVPRAESLDNVRTAVYERLGIVEIRLTH